MNDEGLYDKGLISQIGEWPIPLGPWAMGVPAGHCMGWREVCAVAQEASEMGGGCGHDS